MLHCIMYHFAWADQREKQGYKSDVSLKRGIQIICTLQNALSLAKPQSEVIRITCNMCSRDLPDMYTLGLWAYISDKSLMPILQLLHNQEEGTIS